MCSEKNILANTTFNQRPSTASQEKHQFRSRIQQFTQGVEPSAYTDVTEDLLQASEWLDEPGTEQKVILIVSNLKEGLAEGYVRDDVSLQLAGYEVVALTITKLTSDIADPRKYMGRVDS
ncbi:hypothetical protein [Thiohalorhabdus sp.]